MSSNRYPDTQELLSQTLDPVVDACMNLLDGKGPVEAVEYVREQIKKGIVPFLALSTKQWNDDALHNWYAGLDEYLDTFRGQGRTSELITARNMVYHDRISRVLISNGDGISGSTQKRKPAAYHARNSMNS